MAASSLTSPTIILSGRIRSDDLIRSRILIPPRPSAFALRTSRRTRFGMLLICNSAESSIVIIRSSLGISFERAFKNVVLPDPVPPEIKIL